MRLEAATITVSMDEPCLCLHEENQMRPKPGRPKGSSETEWRRIQTLYVMRPHPSKGHMIATYEEDIGPACANEGFNLLGGTVDPQSGRVMIEHTVAEMREWADEERYLKRTERLMAEMAPIDLVQGMVDYYESIPAKAAKRTVFGADGWWKQRN